MIIHKNMLLCCYVESFQKFYPVCKQSEEIYSKLSETKLRPSHLDLSETIL